MTGAIATEEIVGLTDLTALVPEWWELWRRCPSATPFQSPAWLLPWWQAFAPGQLYAITVRRAGMLAGFAPFYVEESARSRRILLLGIGISDYLDILLDPVDPLAAAEAIVAHIECGGLAWSDWELTEVPPGGDALRLRSPAGSHEDGSPGSACPVLDLPATVAELRCGFSPNQRQNLATARNRAERRGIVTVEAADASSAARMFAALVRLHRVRWASRGEVGVLAEPRVIAFHERALSQLLAAKLLRLYVLRVGDAIAAAYYGFADAGRAYVYLTGFDPAYRFESPGTLLLAHALEQALQDGAREFHFLRGQERYKYAWGASDRWNRRRVFRRMRVLAHAS